MNYNKTFKNKIISQFIILKLKIKIIKKNKNLI